MARFSLRRSAARLLSSCLKPRSAAPRTRLNLDRLEARDVPAVLLNLDPVAPVEEGASSVLTGTVSGLAADNNFNLTIDWGVPGDTQTVTLSGDENGNAAFSIPHTYAQDATYPVSVSLNESPLLVGTDAVFVIDRSGSTRVTFAGSPVGDLNNDGSANTILDAEIAAFIALNQNLIDRGLGNTSKVSVVSFASGAILHDMSPTAAVNRTYTTPLADEDNDGVRDVDQILRSLQDSGSTYYKAAIASANRMPDVMDR